MYKTTRTQSNKKKKKEDLSDLLMHIISGIKNKKTNKQGHTVKQDVSQHFAQPYLREVSILEVCSGHAVQPGPSQFGGAGVGSRQTVLEVQQHLRIFLVLPHLGRGHQHCSDSLSQALHFRGECRGLNHAEKSKHMLTCENIIEFISKTKAVGLLFKCGYSRLTCCQAKVILSILIQLILLLPVQFEC